MGTSVAKDGGGLGGAELSWSLHQDPHFYSSPSLTLQSSIGVNVGGERGKKDGK